MINFHKYGFLDVKKLRKIMDGENYFLERYNPAWLFIWSDTYKPEIAYTLTQTFIRFNMPNIGMCYYPPIGGSLEEGINLIKEDAYENGFEFTIGPVDSNMKYKLENLGVATYLNEELNSYLFNAEALGFYKDKKYKKIKKELDLFDFTNKNTFLQIIKKEDFNQVLEFVGSFKQNLDIKDYHFYNELNMIKKTMDHLYELDLIACVLRDENQIMGFLVASVLNNVTSIHFVISLEEQFKGAYDKIVTSFAKYCCLKTKFINIEVDSCDKDSKERISKLLPFSSEKCYATFGL